MSYDHRQNLRPPWQPGESGNQKGSSVQASLKAKLKRKLREGGLDDQLITTMIIKALGDNKKLKGRKPDLAYIKAILDVLGVTQHGNKKRQDGQMSTPIDAMEPDEAAFMAEWLMRGRQAYANRRTEHSDPVPASDPEESGRGDADEPG